MANLGTVAAFISPNVVEQLTSITTSGGTTTITATSNKQQYFTGTSNQTLVLPVATTLALGQSFFVQNDSTGTITVNTSGNNQLLTIPSASRATTVCINPAGGTGTASWSYTLTSNTGSPVTLSGDVTGSSGSTSVLQISGPNGGGTGLPISSTSGSSGNIYFGYSSTLPTGTSNIGIGYQALNVNTSFGNVAIGNQALRLNTGNTNTAIGSNTLFSNTTGIRNTAVGNGALINNTTANDNTAIGHGASTAGTTATQNVSVGFNALSSNQTGNSNTAVGYLAIQGIINNSTSNSVAVGTSALAGSLNGSTDNTAVGYQAGQNVSTGTNNLILGSTAGSTLQTGSNNVIVGFGANVDAVARVGAVALGQGIIATVDNGFFVKHNASTIPSAPTSGTVAGFKNGTNELVEYPTGTNGQVLSLVSGVPTWISQFTTSSGGLTALSGDVSGVSSIPNIFWYAMRDNATGWKCITFINIATPTVIGTWSNSVRLTMSPQAVSPPLSTFNPAFNDSLVASGFYFGPWNSSTSSQNPFPCFIYYNAGTWYIIRASSGSGNFADTALRFSSFTSGWYP